MILREVLALSLSAALNAPGLALKLRRVQDVKLLPPSCQQVCPPSLAPRLPAVTLSPARSG